MKTLMQPKQTEVTVEHVLRNAGFWIDEDANLAPLTFEVEVTSGRPLPEIKRIWATLNISYRLNGRDDVHQQEIELVRRFGKQTVSVPVPDVRGGAYTFTAFARVKHRNGQIETLQDSESEFIRLRQPVKQNVRAYLSEKNFEVVTFLLSKFEHAGTDNQPSFSNGFGLCRIANPTVEQIWSWKKNADYGKIDFEGRKTAVRQIPANLRSMDPVLYKTLPDFTDAQMLMETLQSYGTGAFYKPKRSGLSGRWKWVPVEDNDGFAKRSEEVRKLVLKGTPPPGWD